MYFPPILHYLLCYFKHIGKHMTKSESARIENMYVDTEGNAYDFAYGLNWSGRINDARVKKYPAK